MSIRSILTAVALTVMAVTATPDVALAGPAATAAERKEFRDAFLEEGGILIREIVAQFPAEYQAFEDSMLEAIANDELTDEEAGRRGFNFTQPLSEKIFEGWKMAPDADLLAATRADMEFALALGRYSQTACAETFEGGLQVETALSLPDATDDLFEKNNASRIRLARAGRAARIQRAPLTETELEAVLDGFVANGGNPFWLVGISTGDFKGQSPAERCASGKTWSQTILGLEPALAARILTSD